jgi:hypothetical protein
MKIPCICIDDKNRPEVIPISKWVKEGDEYNITHVYLHKFQDGGIQGVSLYEKPLDESCAPYETFRLTRFAFTEEGISMLVELITNCTELNDFDVRKLLEESELQIQE